MNQLTYKLTMVMMCITAVLIAVTGVVFKQSFLRILPLFVSLVIMLLNSRLDRKGLLLGGLNSILYTIVYASYRLFASAGYALLVSFPLQIFGFIRWNRKKTGYTTELHKLSTKQRILVTIGFVVCWLILYQILATLNSGYMILDNTVTLIGILSTILMTFAFIEYTWLQLLSGVVTIALYVAMLKENPEQITYVIFSIYSLLCYVLSVFNSRKLYHAQRDVSEEQVQSQNNIQSALARECEN